MHQDSLTGTFLVTSASGTSLGTIKYTPFGETRSGSVPTDKKFTGQRLDATGLYYYGARYYDPTIGRFISADPIIHSEPLPAGQIIKGLTVYCTTVQFYTGQTRTPVFINPQEHNRYSYALNNPLRYTDPDGHQVLAGAEYVALAAFALAFYGITYYCVVAPATIERKDEMFNQGVLTFPLFSMIVLMIALSKRLWYGNVLGQRYPVPISCR